MYMYVVEEEGEGEEEGRSHIDLIVQVNYQAFLMRCVIGVYVLKSSAFI